MRRKMCLGAQVKMQEEGHEESCEMRRCARRHRRRHKGDARDTKQCSNGNMGEITE